jgi:hypothetical protein
MYTLAQYIAFKPFLGVHHLIGPIGLINYKNLWIQTLKER